ncbi:MAG: TAT-variant-translocated molybdopterin oxidoreductase [Candidatus Zixiibacteriota bacterium]
MSREPMKQDKQYWRSLAQIADTPEFREFLHREFPQGAAEMDNSWSRRSFLTLMGASMALAGLAGCRRPVEKVVPYVKQPEEVTVGVPQYYATTMPFGLSAYGLLVKSNEGRPTKIEGNSEHPSSRGATNIWAQSAILDLYDPDRSRLVLRDGVEANWNDFVTFWRERLIYFQANQGQGLALLSESFNSPTLARLASEFRKQFPKAIWATYEPISDENIYEGIRVATGRTLRPVYHVENAQVILALDSDFLQTESENVTAMRGFAEGRRVMSQSDPMNRLYVVESSYSVTGGMADHRLRLQSQLIGQFTLALAHELASHGLRLEFLDGGYAVPSWLDTKWVTAAAKDLLRNQGKSLLLAGRRQPPAVHALVAAVNAVLGNVGTTVTYHELKDAAVPSRAELTSLVQSLRSATIETLVMLGGDPVYNAPADLEFQSAMKKAKQIVHLASHINDTSKAVTWHVPQAHFLEIWGDVRSADGTASLIQPMIEPLFGGKSAIELLSHLTSGRDLRGYDIVRATWQPVFGPVAFESKWQRMLHDGLLGESAPPAVAHSIDDRSVRSAIQAGVPSDSPDAAGMEISFTVAHVWDGRFANNGWLQELPDSVTKLTWDNVAAMSDATAKALGVSSGELVRLTYRGATLEMPAWICPGHADNSISVPLGYGRENFGRVADNVGFNSYRLRFSEAADFAVGVQAARTGQMYELSSVQDHWSMEGRPIVREATYDEYKDKPDFKPEMIDHPPLVPPWNPHKYDTGYQWGMTIDLNACTGCNACTIACQSENNIPIVGKDQVSRGREMHWIRLDRYFAGSVEEPEMVHQPMACQHCENAPCENVCPVAATTHDKEGLNLMVYNRCIGTRYCSNNCPYKVRRFNFYNYTKDLPETQRMQQNPDVTVRFRGVMEKCTYCIQRIAGAKILAKRDGKEIADGEIVTACQQACPTQAIVFGNVNDPNSRVSQIKKANRNYGVLEEYFTSPRTTYLAKLRNPNPELGKTAAG